MEAAIHRCFSKQLFLKISQFSQKNTCFSVSFIKLSASKAVLNFIKKETLALVFSCEFCEISKNTFFYRTLLVAASESFWIPTQSALRLYSFPFQITQIHTLKLDHHQPEHQAFCYMEKEYQVDNQYTNNKYARYGSCHSQMFFKIAVFKNITIFTEKYLRWCFFYKADCF